MNCEDCKNVCTTHVVRWVRVRGCLALGGVSVQNQLALGTTHNHHQLSKPMLCICCFTLLSLLCEYSLCLQESGLPFALIFLGLSNGKCEGKGTCEGRQYTWTSAYSMGSGMQQGHRHAAWALHGHGNTAWAWAQSMGMGTMSKQHGHGHAP